MAVTKILAKDARLDKLIRYVVNPRKTGEQVFVSSVGCVPETAARTWTVRFFHPIFNKMFRNYECVSP